MSPFSSIRRHGDVPSDSIAQAAAHAERLFARPARRRMAKQLGASFRRHRWLLVVVGLYTAAGVAVAARFGLPAMRSTSLYVDLFDGNIGLLGTMGFGVASVMLAGLMGHVGLIERPPRPLSHLRGRLRGLLTAERVSNAVPVLLVFPLFASTTTVIKATILRVHAFDWDLVFARLDRSLHAGHDLWYWLQPIFGHALVTRGLDWVYAAWFVILYCLFFWQTFATRRPQLRMQFLWTLVLSWILLGSIAATIFASAGPCYFGRITGLADPYAPLMHYLHQVARHEPLIALRGQAFLWAGYEHRAVQPFDGISAMPSMHVSMATLFALFGWRVSRRFGAALTVFAALIFIGSVELAWHYAIDGYAAALGTIAIWYAVGRAQRRARPVARAPVRP